MMIHKQILSAAVAILPVVNVLAAGPKNEKPFIVTAEEYSKAPISPLLYGNFIELGYGRQVEAMYSELPEPKKRKQVK